MPPLGYDIAYDLDTASCCSSQIDATSSPIKPLASAADSPVVSSILKKSSSDNKKQPRRSVSFKESVRVRPTLSYKNYTEDELEATWYTETETLQIRYQTKLVVQQMMKKSTASKVDGRGLEYRTKHGYKERKAARMTSRQIVLDEQLRQKEMEDYDPTYLALLYTDACVSSKTTAHKFGLMDESIAKQVQALR